MLRKGLSEKEINEMSVVQYYELFLLDTFLEPQGPVVDDLRNAFLQHTIMMSSANMTAKYAKQIKLKDFSMYKDESVFKSPEELAEIEKKKQEEKRKAIEAQFNPALLEKAKRLANKGA